MLTVVSHPMMGATFWRCSSEAVSTQVVRVLLSNSVSHYLTASATCEPAERERSGNRKILTMPPTPSGSSVWNASLISIPVTA